MLDVCYWASNAIKAGMAMQTEGVDLQKLSFGFLNPENWTDRFFRNVGKKFHYLLRNNPEQLSSQVYWLRFAVLTGVTMKILRKEASGSSKRRYFVKFKMIVMGKPWEILLWRTSYWLTVILTQILSKIYSIWVSTGTSRVLRGRHWSAYFVKRNNFFAHFMNY
jgi:hypothetical protein